MTLRQCVCVVVVVADLNRLFPDVVVVVMVVVVVVVRSQQKL